MTLIQRGLCASVAKGAKRCDLHASDPCLSPGPTSNFNHFYTAVPSPQLEYIICRSYPALYFYFHAIWSNFSPVLCVMQFCNVVNRTEACIRTSARGRLILVLFTF